MLDSIPKGFELFTFQNRFSGSDGDSFICIFYIQFAGQLTQDGLYLSCLFAELRRKFQFFLLDGKAQAVLTFSFVVNKILFLQKIPELF
jgi:hypothetical protein